MKRTIAKIAVLIVAANVFALAAFAQVEGNPENWCRNGLFPREPADFKIARVNGARNEPVYFHVDSAADCPQGKNCRSKKYLVPGDEVIAARVFGRFVCVWHQSARGGETVGWIAAARLESIENTTGFATEDWLGRWRHYDNSIEIRRGNSADALKVTGTAVWKGPGDNIHVGELDGEKAPVGSLLDLAAADGADEFDCRARMRRVGRFLIVADNSRCGGANVTFTGVYQRAQKR